MDGSRGEAASRASLAPGAPTEDAALSTGAAGPQRAMQEQTRLGQHVGSPSPAAQAAPGSGVPVAPAADIGPGRADLAAPAASGPQRALQEPARERERLLAEREAAFAERSQHLA